MSSSHRWSGVPARHRDGREGVIRERAGWCWVDLLIERDGHQIGLVQLACDGPDRGEEGWAWLWDKGSGDPVWLPLGEFNIEAVIPASSAAATSN